MKFSAGEPLAPTRIRPTRPPADALKPALTNAVIVLDAAPRGDIPRQPLPLQRVAPLAAAAFPAAHTSCPTFREGGEGRAVPVFCPAYPALSPDTLAADAAAVGASPGYYREMILPQWADSRRDVGGTSRDWRANARRFARTFLTYERDHGRLPDAPGEASGFAVMGFPTPHSPHSQPGSHGPRTRAPSTDKYTVAAIRGSLDALDLLVQSGAGAGN